MTPTSFAVPVAPRTGKIIKNGLLMFLKDEKICYKMVYYTLYLSKPIARNCVAKLEFIQAKNGLF